MVYLRTALTVIAAISAAPNLISAETPDNVSSRLSIHIPHSLFKESGYDHREALFGFPPYGGSIAQNVYYADSDLCDPTVDTRKGYPEREVDETGMMAPWPSPFILMVDRGGCTFVQKVRNAQRAGSAGVIIADNTCLCSDKTCMKETGATECQSAEPIMADDGSGSDITIPAFLMFKHDSDKVKDVVTGGDIVQIEMQWALPSPDDRVEYDLWTVPTESVSREFQESFRHVAKALDKRAYFTPHMYIYDGMKNGCRGRDGSNQCYNLCTNNGRYCATDPDNNLDQGISGADVVIESLRRICIWKHYGESDGIGLKWWDYVNEFNSRCASDPDFFTDEDCIKDVYKHAGVDKKKIEQCMKDSGGTSNDSPNAFLDNELDAQVRRGVVVLPTAFVNTAAIRGALSVSNVFTAICAGYLSGTRPSVCDACDTCSDKEECARKGYCASDGGSGITLHTFILSMLAVAGIVGSVGVYQYRRSQDEMRDQVRGILAEYMPLEDQDGGLGNDINPATSFAHRAGQTLID